MHAFKESLPSLIPVTDLAQYWGSKILVFKVGQTFPWVDADPDYGQHKPRPSTH